ncbi:MAG: amidohydrolase [Maricaulaceae bacterium]
MRYLNTKLALSLLCCLSLPQTALADISHKTIDKMVSAAQPDVVELRRWFHQYPELSNREFKTSKRIAKELRKLGLEPQTGIAKTGVVALLKGGKNKDGKGPTIALRADIDGLPVTEQTGLPFASTQTTMFDGQEVGVMHACGHDSHIAMLLGAAKVLTEIQDELEGDVLFIFQPAEEGAPKGEEGGAELMLKEGLFDTYKPDVVFGMHVGLNMPGGKIAVRPGPAMAAVDSFEMTIKGKQTHGARPWGGIDPIVTASQIVMGLQTIASRQINVTKAPSIITVGKISGGVRYNIIPDEVKMLGTIRTFDEDMRTDIHKRIEQTAKSIAESAGAEAEFLLLPFYPVTVNNPDLTLQMLPTLQRLAGAENVLKPDLVTGAEDFSYFANEVPGMFMFLGSVEDGVDPKTAPSNHSPMFTIHEPVMETGVSTFVHLTLDYIKAH